MAEHAAPVMAARPLLVLVLASLATAQHQTFRQQPGDTTAVAGDTVGESVECNVDVDIVSPGGAALQCG